MPLSEHEQRLLEQIEQALYADDPKFASAVRSARPSMGLRKRLVLAVLGVILGFGIVLVALLAKVPPLAVPGFVLIVGSCAWAVASARHSSQSTPSDPSGINVASRPADGDARRPTRGMRSRMEDRLRRRFDQDGQ